MMDRNDVARIDAAAKLATSSTEKGLGSSLCNRCQNSTIFRRRGRMDVIVRCAKMGDGEVPGDIVECSGFEDMKAMDLYNMQQIALSIDKRQGVNDGSYR